MGIKWNHEFPHSKVFAHLGFDATSLGTVEQLGRTWRGTLFHVFFSLSMRSCRQFTIAPDLVWALLTVYFGFLVEHPGQEQPVAEGPGLVPSELVLLASLEDHLFSSVSHLKVLSGPKPGYSCSPLFSSTPHSSWCIIGSLQKFIEWISKCMNESMNGLQFF